MPKTLRTFFFLSLTPHISNPPVNHVTCALEMHPDPDHLSPGHSHLSPHLAHCNTLFLDVTFSGKPCHCVKSNSLMQTPHFCLLLYFSGGAVTMSHPPYHFLMSSAHCLPSPLEYQLLGTRDFWADSLTDASSWPSTDLGYGLYLNLYRMKGWLKEDRKGKIHNKKKKE